MGLSSATELIVNFLTSRQLLPGSWANAVTNALCSIQTATASATQTQAGGTKITSASAAITQLTPTTLLHFLRVILEQKSLLQISALTL